MGLLFSDGGTTDLRADQESALLQRLGCKACPLRCEPGRMAPTGSDSPLIYVLGEAPGKNEIEHGEQFVGRSGQLLRSRIPSKLMSKIRWNNVCRSRPPNNRTPERPEIEACRPSIVEDIERAKPKAIFGFGNVPLRWVTNYQFDRITFWRGRRMPVVVGEHTCWYYPMLHPSFLLRQGARKSPRSSLSPTAIGSEDERMFVFDLEQAFADLEKGLPDPIVHTPEMARAGVEIITDMSAAGLRRIETHLVAAANCDVVGIDYETNALRPYNKSTKVLTAAVATPTKALAFAFDHSQASWSKQHREHLQDLWIRFLTTAKCYKAVHNVAFELEWSGVKFDRSIIQNASATWEDTMSQAAVLDERTGKGKPGCFALEFLVQQWFGFNIKKLSGLDRANLDRAPLDRVLEYNAIDAKYHLKLFREQDKAISDAGLGDVYDLSLRRVPAVVMAQMKGVPVDQKEVSRLHKKYETRVAKLEADIKAIPVVKKFKTIKKQEFNPGSQPDLIYLLVEMLKRRECRIKDKYTSEYKYSADEEVLAKIDHPIAKAVVDLRKASKRKSTYIDPLKVGSETCVIYDDGLSHATFNTVFARTARLSCVRAGTHIQIPGGVKPVEDIAVGDWVYCFDRNSKLVLRKVKSTWFRGLKSIVRVHWVGQGGARSKGYLDVTPDHRIRLVGGNYVRADKLRTGKPRLSRKQIRMHGGDHVMALSRGVKGGRNWLYATGASGGYKESRFIFEQVNGWAPEHVHHLDENCLNDSPYNLVGMSHRDHCSLHAKQVSSIPGEMTRRALMRSADVVARVSRAVAQGARRRALKRFSCDDVVSALIRGKGIKGACKILNCDYSSVRNRIDWWGIERSIWDGHSLRKDRPEQRKNRSPYKGRTEYAHGRPKYNHVISHIEVLSGVHPVYDLEVDDAHNFIANEICVHNCEGPNWQNVPKRSEEAVEVRKQVKAKPGCSILSLDYGQIEARASAMHTRDKIFCKALWERYDVHQEWALRIAKSYPDIVGGSKMLSDKKAIKKFRDAIKNGWTFPLFYGASLESVAGYLEIPVPIISPHYRAFWKEFAGVHTWQDQQIKFYHKYGYVEALTKRRRHGPLSNNKIFNSPVQTTAAEIVMDAMARLVESGDEEIFANLQIHDDLIFIDIPDERLEEVAEKVLNVLLTIPKYFPWINVPLTVEMTTGKNWMPFDEHSNPDGMKEFGTFSSDEWWGSK